ncbi:MAG: ribonuclease P protein component [Prevotellaceae bacterium]|jgi:ribonuclease P protein component|nr:ribonuclease P protein component [Prevotellaceae bacterium]
MRFPKSERLCSQKQIAALFTAGDTLFHFPFKIFFSIAAAEDGKPCCQMAVNVPKRRFKRAVKRNLLKRRIREAFRRNKQIVYQPLEQQRRTASLFFHYVSPEILDYVPLETSLCEALAKLADVVTQSGHCPAGSAD